jgi:hypothetical protein
MSVSGCSQVGPVLPQFMLCTPGVDSECCTSLCCYRGGANTRAALQPWFGPNWRPAQCAVEALTQPLQERTNPQAA